MKLLHLDSSILGDLSVSRQLSALIVDRLTEGQAGLAVTHRDLAEQDYPHARLTTLPYDPDSPIAPSTQDPQQARSEAALEEFLQTDILVIGAPMYNYTVPSQLKAWIDRILIARKTFRYGPNGPEGLVSGKRVVIAVTSGGIYSPGSPGAMLDHASTYLRGVFGTIGLTAEIIVAEGLAMGPEARAQGIAAAREAIAALPA